MRLPERAALALGVLCLVLLVLVEGRPYFTTASIPPRGIKDPQVALQMVRSVREVDAILGEAPSPDREVMRMKQYIDFAFIASYAALFLVMTWALLPLSRWAWTIGIFGALAAWYDVQENIDILRLVEIPLSAVRAQLIHHLHFMSVAKWGFAAGTVALLGIFTLRSRRWYMRWIAAVDFLAAATILWGQMDNAMLVWAGLPLAAGMLANAATLKFLRPDIPNLSTS